MTAPPRKDHTMKFMMFVVSDAQPDITSDESDIDLWVDPLDASGKRVIGEAGIPDSSERMDQE